MVGACAAPTAMQTRWTAVGRAHRIKGKCDGPFHRAPRETKKSDMGVARECFRVVRRSPAEKEPGMRDEFKAKQCLVSATPRCDNGNAQGPERITNSGPDTRFRLMAVVTGGDWWWRGGGL